MIMKMKNTNWENKETNGEEVRRDKRKVIKAEVSIRGFEHIIDIDVRYRERHAYM